MLQKKLEDSSIQADSFCAIRFEKERCDAVKQAIDDTTVALTRKYAIELADLKAGYEKRIQRAVDQANKHAAGPHLSALAAEMAKREMLEADLAALQTAAEEAAVAREAETRAREEMAEAKEMRAFMETYVTQQIMRAKEFVSSNEERVALVRKYAEALESALAKVDEEKHALQKRAQKLAQQEVAVFKLDRAVDEAIKSRDTIVEIENAMAAKRVIELEVLTAKADLKLDIYAALAKAAAAERAQNETLAMIGPSKNDAEMKRVAEMRLKAVTLDLEATIHEFAQKREADCAEKAVSLAEANGRASSAESVVAKLNPEVHAFELLAQASSVRTHATFVANEYDSRVQEAEAKAVKMEVEANAEATMASALARMEYIKDEAAATMEANEAELAARATASKVIADTTLEAEKTIRSIKEEQVAAEADAVKEAEKVNRVDTEVSANAQSVARIEQANRSLEAYKEWSQAIMKATDNELKAQTNETDALNAVLEASKGWQKVEAEKKAATAKETNKEIKRAAHEARAVAQAVYDKEVLNINKDAERKVITAQTTLGKATAGTQSRLKKVLEELGAKYEALLTENTRKSHLTILEASTSRETELAKVRSEKKRALDAALSKRDATLAMIEETRIATIADARAQHDTAFAGAARAALAAGGKGSSTDALRAFEAEAFKEVKACEARVATAKAAREAAVASAAEANADALVELAAAKEGFALSVKEAEHTREQSRRTAEDIRSKASAMVSELKLGAEGTLDKARKQAVAVMDAEAKRAKDEAEAARNALTKAESAHVAARAKAANVLERQLKAIDEARAEAAAQLEKATAEMCLLQELEAATAEADAARKEANLRRSRSEADRRKAEEARMAGQHESICRRPGGKLFFERLRQSQMAGRDRQTLDSAGVREETAPSPTRE